MFIFVSCICVVDSPLPFFYCKWYHIFILMFDSIQLPNIYLNWLISVCFLFIYYKILSPQIVLKNIFFKFSPPTYAIYICLFSLETLIFRPYRFMHRMSTGNLTIFHVDPYTFLNNVQISTWLFFVRARCLWGSLRVNSTNLHVL